MSVCLRDRWPQQPRARTYSWNRNQGPDPLLRPGSAHQLRPGSAHQLRPGSAPLYGRLLYGVHAPPVLGDFLPVGGPVCGSRSPEVTWAVTRSSRRLATPPLATPPTRPERKAAET